MAFQYSKAGFDQPPSHHPVTLALVIAEAHEKQKDNSRQVNLCKSVDKAKLAYN